MSKLFEHLNEVGLVVKNEIVHDIETIEGWLSSRFGSVPLPEGHNVRMTDRESDEVVHLHESTEGGDQSGDGKDSSAEDQAPGGAAPEAGGAAGQDHPEEEAGGSGEEAGAAGTGSEVRTEPQQEVAGE